jgi:hypothetical protein
MHLGKIRFIALAVMIVTLVACSVKPTYYIKIEVPGAEGNCRGVNVDFTAYDYSQVMDSLIKVNTPGPRPDSSELIGVVAEYKGSLALKTALSDSVNTMRDDLEKLKNTSIEYRKLLPVFQSLEKVEQQKTQELQTIHQKYIDVKGAYDSRVQAWGAVAFKGFSDFKAGIRPDYQTKSELTDQNCMIKKLNLPYGQWWLHTELRRPGTVNEKFIWNIKLPLSGGDSLMILLDDKNAQLVNELL